MATRRERVVLELEDRFSPGMIRAAIVSQAADKAINDLDGTTLRTNKTLDVGATQARKQARSLDDLESSARRAERGSSALTDVLFGFGPALLPIGAVAVPAVAGLAAQLGFAAAAGGTALLAFNGVGDALKALDAYQLEPTTANLEKLHQVMGKLGPDGREFVHQLDALEPKLKSLKRAAEAGILPGVSEGLDSLLTRLPQVRRIVAEISDATGDLFADAGDSLAGSDYDAFFAYLEDNGRPILDDLGRTVGNLTLTLANLFTATAPEQREFSSWLLGITRDMEGWSEALPDDQGFAAFMDYVHETGPELADTLGSIANAVVQVTEAAAPMSGPTLKILGSLADILATIADSPAGTPLVAAASGLALINRALSASALAKNSLVADLIYGKQLNTGGRGPDAFGRVRAQLQGFSGDVKAANAELLAAQQQQAIILNRIRSQAQGGALVPRADRQQSAQAYVASQNQVAEATKRVTAAEAERSARFRDTAGKAARAGVAVGALALATTDYAQNSNAASTASLAAAGSLAGPWGAAAGAALGLTMDLAAANDGLEDAIKRSTRATEDGSNAALDASAKKLRAEIAANEKSRTFTMFGNPLNNLGSLVAGTNELFTRTSEKAKIKLDANEAQRQLNEVNAKAILAAQGLRTTSAGARELTMTSKEMAAQLTKGQEALNLQAGLDRYQASLDAATASLKANGKTLDGNTEKGRANRASLREIAQSAVDASEGLKGVGKTKFLDNARRQFVTTAQAAGKTKKQAQDMADEFGLINRLDVKPKVRADTGPAKKNLGDLLGVSKEVGRQRPKIKPTVDDSEARNSARILKDYLRNVFGAPIVQTIRTNRIGTNGNGGNDLAKPQNRSSTSRAYTSDSSRSTAVMAPDVYVAAPSLEGLELAIPEGTTLTIPGLGPAIVGGATAVVRQQQGMAGVAARSGPRA